MHSSQIDRASTNLRALRSRNFSNRDNSFATARNLGTFFAAPASTRASGSIGRSDRKDVIKFTFAPGFSTSSSSGRLIIRGGSLTFSVYVGVEGERPQLQFTRRGSSGTYPLASAQVPTLPLAFTAYIVFDRPTQNVRYNYREDYQP